MSIIVIKITSSSKNKFGVFFAHLDYTLLQSLRKVNLDSISRKKKNVMDKNLIFINMPKSFL